jgi:magnesium transporter
MLQKLAVQAGKVVPTESDAAPVLVVLNPDPADRRHLLETLAVDEHTLNSALDPDEVPRIEFEPDHLAIVFKRPRTYRAEDNLVFKVVSTGLFLFDRRLVVVLSDNVPLFEGKPLPASASPADLPTSWATCGPSRRSRTRSRPRSTGPWRTGTCSACSRWRRAWSIT